MGRQAKKIFVNMPVKDLEKTKQFFGKLGFEFNAQFTDANAACMIVSEDIYVMLLVEGFFQTFTDKEIVDATKSTEAIVALSAASKEEVVDIVNKAFAAGGKPTKDAMDHGFMYQWGFEDLDGHQWEFLYMDESAVQQ